MPSKGKGKPTGRKHGGQKGNKNALRHGFYSKDFTATENRDLDKQDDISVKAEIALIRTCLRRLQTQLSFDEIMRQDNNGTDFRDTHYLQQLNTLAIMTQSISTLIRTHYLVTGKSGDVTDTIMQALEELRIEMGL